MLALSPWLEERADAYRDHLFAVGHTGEWAPWIEFFAQAVAAEARSGHDRIMRPLALREEIGGIVRTAHPRARLAVEIADAGGVVDVSAGIGLPWTTVRNRRTSSTQCARGAERRKRLWRCSAPLGGAVWRIDVRYRR